MIAAASIFAAEQLGLPQSQLITSILLVQFVAFGGALLFGRIARRTGAQRAILASLVLWVVVVAVGFVLPAHRFGLFLALAVLIGVVLGGSQALARSLYSQLVPRGARRSTSASTSPPSEARAGREPCSSGWCSSSRTPTGRRSSRWSSSSSSAASCSRGSTSGAESSTPGTRYPAVV